MVEPTWPAPATRHANPASAAFSQPAIGAIKGQAAGSESPSVAECADAGQCLIRLLQRGSVCVAWNRTWAGTLGDTMLFHAKRIGPDRVAAGYFAYWTTERPWGKNALTRQLLPALAIDAVYSHLLFVLPGLKTMLYGPGDVEGLRVTYAIGDDHQLVPISVFADDGGHNEVRLDTRDAVDEFGRVVVLTNVWSHQLGAKGAMSAVRAGATKHCFTETALQPVTAETALAFRLGDVQAPLRARPAWRLPEPTKPASPNSGMEQAARGQGSRLWQ